MNRLLAFLVRDARAAASYRLGFVLNLISGLLTLTLFFFVARTVGEVPLTRARYGADYFAFALVGIAMAALLRGAQTSFAGRVREAQLDGSLESLFAAPLASSRLVLLMGAYPILNGLLRLLGLLAAGVWIFGARLNVHWADFALATALSLMCFVALGLMAAAIVLVLKRADPITWALDLLSWLLSGVVYPLDVLPPALRALSPFLPATHALSALRGAVFGVPNPRALAALALFAAVLWPLALLALTWARQKVEADGTLAHS